MFKVYFDDSSPMFLYYSYLEAIDNVRISVDLYDRGGGMSSSNLFRAK